VRGKLKRLPKNHEIWLLTEHPSGCVWPQGKAEFNRHTGEWEGHIHTQEPHQKIVAVVALPTSQEFFKYFRQYGRRTDYAALNRVPVECKNVDSVDAHLEPRLKEIPDHLTFLLSLKRQETTYQYHRKAGKALTPCALQICLSKCQR
jgi:hypothetical protein